MTCTYVLNEEPQDVDSVLPTGEKISGIMDLLVLVKTILNSRWNEKQGTRRVFRMEERHLFYSVKCFTWEKFEKVVRK